LTFAANRCFDLAASKYLLVVKNGVKLVALHKWRETPRCQSKAIVGESESNQEKISGCHSNLQN